MEGFTQIMAMCIPILAIVGGLGVAVVRLITQARLEELARRERIAAIERGVDPSKLPPIPGAGADYVGPGNGKLHRAQGMLIGALIVLAVGLGLSIMLYVFEPQEKHWIIGIIPTLVGCALLASSAIVWPRKS
jgi:hypothetical protein